jgi:hypothetical protein
VVGAVSWAQRRNRFQHDWLKNRFILQLGQYLNVLDDLVEDPDFEQRFLTHVVPDWSSHRTEVIDLARDFENEMSPRTLFREPPLNTLPAATSQWLAETVHMLWRARLPVDRLVRDCLAAVEQVDRAHAGLWDAGKVAREKTPGSRPSRQAVVELLAACRELARTLGSFPLIVRLL